MFLTKTTTNLFHKGLNFNKCCALNFVCNRLQLKFTSQARPKMYCNKQEHLNVTLRMSDSSTSETFTTASSVQLLQILDQYSSHIGHNINALFFRSVIINYCILHA